MNTEYAIFGAGPFAKLISQYIRIFGKGTISEYVVDDDFVARRSFIEGQPTAWSDFKKKRDFDQKPIILGVGYQDLVAKQALGERIIMDGGKLINLCLTKNLYGPISFSGVGNVILPGASVETGVCLGSGNILWSGCHVCHDVSVGNYNFFAARALIGGQTVIGNRNFFGFASILRDNISISDDIVLGMGTVCTRSLQDPGRYFRQMKVVKDV